MEEEKEYDLTQEEETYYDGLTYAKKTEFATVISKPMAPEKLGKKIMKLLSSASKHKKLILGVKSVPKAIKKKKNGIVVIAGDVTPIDVVIHIPKLCEAANVPYCFLPCRRDVGIACGSKKSIAIVMIELDESYSVKFNKLSKKVLGLPLSL